MCCNSRRNKRQQQTDTHFVAESTDFARLSKFVADIYAEEFPIPYLDFKSTNGTARHIDFKIQKKK